MNSGHRTGQVLPSGQELPRPQGFVGDLGLLLYDALVIRNFSFVRIYHIYLFDLMWRVLVNIARLVKQEPRPGG